MENQLVKSPISQIKAYTNNDEVKGRFEEMLGKRSGAYLNSIINVVRGSDALQKCAPASIMSAAVVAATLNLPIDPALGQAAIVPYKGTAQFQIMYKGVTQLCIRSGQYQTIHCAEIYKDELKSHNPITGVVKFHNSETYKMRDSGKCEVVGHYAYFKLITGFEKSDFMTAKQVMAHAEKYSKAYQYDLRVKKKASPWSINPIQMGNKTILLRLLKKYGVMSIEMQDAIVKDNSFEAAEENARKKIDSEQGSEPIDANFEKQEQTPEPELTSAQKAAKTKAANKKKKEAAQTQQKQASSLYTCKACGSNFDNPKISGEGAAAVSICPNTGCLSKNIVANEEFMND